MTPEITITRANIGITHDVFKDLPKELVLEFDDDIHAGIDDAHGTFLLIGSTDSIVR
jgi:hypothetical protein